MSEHEHRHRHPVTGVYRVEEGAGPIPHHEGWDNAVSKALKDLGWPPGDYTAHVELWAKINVRNPGTIVEYCATIIG